ncbi:DMT family transporter [Desulfoplanes formicivorans]|uniref:DMT family transporter n=1 Tax=Desulfoplanes formicivorans TaxID=1592317 RepID=UPI0008531198|nr:DMT family transporter [Desulfoplanes formicivorans]
MKTFSLFGSDTMPVLGLILAMLLWGSSFLALKIAFTGFDPLVTIWARMLIAFFVFVCVWKRFSRVVYLPGDWKYLVLMALCEPCMYFTFEAYALTQTTASQAGMITAMLPLIVALMARFFLGERISRRTMTGFCVAISGAVLMSLNGTPEAGAPRPLLGNILELGAMCWGAGYTICLKKLSARYPPLFLTAVQTLVGSVFFTVPVVSLPWIHFPETLPLIPVLAIVYLAVAVSMGAYGLYNFGVSRLPAGQASAFTNLVPVFALFLGWLVFEETLLPLQWVGAACVMVGVVISRDGRAPGSEQTRT